MQIASVASNTSFIDSRAKKDSGKSPEDHLQDVFSVVLAGVGREGYRSADSSNHQESLSTEITSSWEQWFDGIAPSRYQFEFNSGNPSVRKGKTAEDLKSDYGKILSDAYRSGGYATPGKFLKGLSTEELQTIQQVQHLADSIDLGGLSDEASLNLLLPPDAQVDANHDGLTAVGAGYSLRFPDSNTPKEVKEAWEKATQGMPEMERMIYELQMTFPLITANIHTDEDGNYLGSSNPGDADWVNPMASKSYSFKDSANSWLEYLDLFRNQMPPEQFARDKKFWTTFRDQLVR